MCRNDFCVSIPSHSHDFIPIPSPIPIYSQKVISIPSHSHWNMKSFKKSYSSARKRNNEWFSLE